MKSDISAEDYDSDFYQDQIDAYLEDKKDWFGLVQMRGERGGPGWQ